MTPRRPATIATAVREPSDAVARWPFTAAEPSDLRAEREARRIQARQPAA